jgi:hypothetical protein
MVCFDQTCGGVPADCPRLNMRGLTPRCCKSLSDTDEQRLCEWPIRFNTT